MRVLVCGGRNYGVSLDPDADVTLARAQLKRVFDELDAIMRPAFAAGDKEFVIIHGGATGADDCADTWARRRNVEREVYPACKAETKLSLLAQRARTLAEGKPDLVVAFPGGKGTADMVKRARKAGVRVVTID